MRSTRRLVVYAAGLMAACTSNLMAGDPERGDLPPLQVPKEVIRFELLPRTSIFADSAFPQDAFGNTISMLEADLNTLTSFGTRHTLSETESETRGIGAARRWVADRFREAGEGVVVTLESNLVRGGERRIPRDVEVVNVVCEISARWRPRRGGGIICWRTWTRGTPTGWTRKGMRRARTTRLPAWRR
ncbi:MAG: hypothetical protein R3B46_06115 [Phycisphaerales bacterium]